jgi:hypothetical protein
MPPVTRDVVLLLVGAVFMLIGLIGNIKIREIFLQISNAGRCIFVVTGVVLLALGVFNDSLFPARVAESGVAAKTPDAGSPAQGRSQSAGIAITQPADGDVVGAEADVSGTYDPAVNDDIWVFVWPEKAQSKGWPQTDDARLGLPCAKRDGRWTVHCLFGGPAQSYRVVVYTATPAASQVITANLRNWYGKNDYMGISRASLPQGLKEQGEIKVRKGA